MIESQRREYLEAMGLPVWVSKFAPPAAVYIHIGPGSGSTLLLCREAGERSGRIASDISRYLGGDPAWAWPAGDSDPSATTLDGAIDQHLFTRLVILGSNLAGSLFENTQPEVMGSARVLVSADLDELAVSGEARHALWTGLSEAVPG